jgi:hypothetical protein
MLDVQDVAAHLGVPPDPRMEAATQAAVAWVEARRCLTPPSVLWADPSVVLGATLYAAHLYAQRAAPTGMDAFADQGADAYNTMAEVYRLVGADPVVA